MLEGYEVMVRMLVCFFLIIDEKVSDCFCLLFCLCIVFFRVIVISVVVNVLVIVLRIYFNLLFIMGSII